MAIGDVYEKVDGVWTKRLNILGPAPPLVSSLPASPVDGQECYYLADATNGVIWHLRYRAAATGSYKWEFIGGPRLSAAVATSQQTASTAYTDLGTVGPSITLPLAGDYDITLAARLISVVGNLVMMSYAIGATAAVDADAYHAGGSASTVDVQSGRPDNRKTFTAASTILTCKYRVSGGAAASFLERRITATPIRVG